MSRAARLVLILIGAVIVGAVGVVALLVIVATTYTPTQGAATTAAPTHTRAESPVASPQEAIRRDLTERFGDRLRSVSVSPALTTIEFDLADNPTHGLRRISAKRDVMRALESAHRSLGPDECRIAVYGFAPMQDQYGNVESRRVVMVRFARSEIATINWSQFDAEQIYTLSEAQTVHPQFR